MKLASVKSRDLVFEGLYDKLNPAQKKAVDTIDGPVMVIAGPGTGKTQILALRIANILQKTDTSPDSILALTFTESGVSSMRKRLVSIIGTPAYKIKITTFHSFCNDLIQEYPEEFGRILGSNPVSDIDQIQIMEKLISEEKLEYLKPFGDQFYYLRPILSAIRNLKRENVDPETFEKLVKGQEKDFKKIPDLVHEKGAHKGKMKGEYADLEKKISKNKELGLLYKKYEQALRDQKLYDYEDMLIEAIHACEQNSDFLLRLQEKYQYILADEHQDSNQAQNRILELISGFFETPNLFIVGDEKQAIFRFQGASLANFLYFKKKYSQAEIISLEHNYRSTQLILDGSHSLIEKNNVIDESLRIKLKAHAAHSTESEKVHPRINLCEFNNADNEYAFLAHEIQEHSKRGIHLHDIAIIYRDNRDAAPIARTLEKAGIIYSLHSDLDIMSDPDIQNFVTLLRSLHEWGNSEACVQMLYLNFLDISNLDVHKIIHYSSRNKKQICDVLESEGMLTEAGIKNVEKIGALFEKISALSKKAKNNALVAFLELVMTESGFVSHLLSQPGSLEKMTKLTTFFNEAKKVSENNKSARLADFMKYLETVKQYGILIKSSGKEGNEGVRLMTAHKSKGLEFDHVYIVGAYDTHWGNKRDIKYFHIPVLGLESHGIDPMEDERRLFYVALTRAKKSISISWSKTGISGKEQLPAQFIGELDPQLTRMQDMTEFEKKCAASPEKQFSVSVAQEARLELADHDFLKATFLEQGLSVTALNKYLRCPWEFFFTSLIRIPEAETKHQLYGQAVHFALKEFFNAYKKEEDMSKDMLLKIFESDLYKKHISEKEYLECLDKGKKALSGYYDTYKNSWSRNLVAEYGISGLLEECIEGTPLLLKGFIDKLEFIDERQVIVVDYKTKQPESRNWIMGATKNSDGDYYRQLVFYKLLLSLDDKKKYEMQSGQIDFIESDPKGNYKKESFEIADQEVIELKEKIKTVANEIYSFAFWERRCDDKECRYCQLRNRLT